MMSTGELCPGAVYAGAVCAVCAVCYRNDACCLRRTNASGFPEERGGLRAVFTT